MKEMKIRQIKNMVITKNENLPDAYPMYSVYTKDEWIMGQGYRTPEFEGCTLEEAISQAKNY